MDHINYELDITDEDLELKGAAHKFAKDVLRPAGIKIDRMTAEEATSADSPLFEVMRQATELGYNRMGAPENMGGSVVSPLAAVLVNEELAWGNMGLAGAIGLSSAHASIAMALGSEEIKEEFARPFFECTDGSIIGCWAVTEPDHGSDTLGVMQPEMVVKARGQLIARKTGDDYILNGQKAAWVSNGPIATHAMLNVHLDPDNTLDQGGICLLPLNLPGISRGKPLDKLGVRAMTQGEIFFDDVRIPKRYMLLDQTMFAPYMNIHLAMFNAGVGTFATGLARAAYDAAYDYAQNRIQGGKPIIEHQSVRARLFRMFTLLQTCQSLSRGVFVYNATAMKRGVAVRLEHSIASKVYCTNSALEIATLGLQLHGGNGMTKEYPCEMFVRDATALTVADGENAYLAQLAASML
ncbi:MAG: acyl-CoA/acyl-ACP dehydrogenase [Gammaproteobacteria bacterium]|jgi:alkylation response protein AidB-like acyl-CoA dehydrogenase|nr:acyl-CoA/acyl-ACP dehydrogenase [Gammaproteobacteria bacterium]MBT4492656.1 acyl-CoA/acyl-ACP dehydrogenase [Gammaproteobacteria bacterium]